MATPSAPATAPATASTNSPTESASPTNTAVPTLTPTPNPYANLSIDALAQRAYGGGQLDIVDTLASDEMVTRYLITYPSDGLTIYGFMDVPNEGDNFPVALVLHGY
ncbi:MAG: hypothetical protein R3300_06270, partial [Candidatus Promineifilaceae bacterium]|nr:hypothetical protein [Candidatus Promineifilaceae bacterium]